MLSTRGAHWATIDFAHGPQNTYDPVTNPTGVVSFANAENWLMHDDMSHFINTHNIFDKSCVSYNEGYTGTTRLRRATAAHLNKHFKPVSPIDAEQITFAAGVTDLNEVCALVTCDAHKGETIMLGKPVYGAFYRDLTTRSGIELEYVDVGDTEQFSSACAAHYEAAFEAAKERGVNIRALIICNPHNPLGQCYPRDTLVALLRLCAAKGIHLISDEIYALSVYGRNDRQAETFTSVRSIDFDGLIDHRLVHVLYGMSKDYGAGGMRLGCIVSENEELTKAVRAICRFSSPSNFSMELASKFLEDQVYVESFLEKSRKFLLKSRMLAEEMLDTAGIEYHRKGNAGLFIWIDLSPFLPLSETDGEEWAAERLLSRRLNKAGVIMSTGEAYHAPKAGRFRLVFCMYEDTLREGIKRIQKTLGK